MAKHYNPFKMWLSYVGALIGFIVSFMGVPIAIMGGNLSYILIALATILGFLVGWGIQSIVRRLR